MPKYGITISLFPCPFFLSCRAQYFLFFVKLILLVTSHHSEINIHENIKFTICEATMFYFSVFDQKKNCKWNWNVFLSPEID